MKSRKGTFPLTLEHFARYVSSEEALQYIGQDFDSKEGAEKLFFQKHPDLFQIIYFHKLENGKVRMSEL